MAQSWRVRRYAGAMSVSPVQSVDRAVTILKLLAQDEGLTVSEVAEQLDVHVSTASRLVSGLRAHDLVERSQNSGGLRTPDLAERSGSSGGRRLVVGLLRLAGVMVSRLAVATYAQPVCDALAAQVGETTNVASLDGEAAINVWQAQGASTVAMQNWV